MVYTSLANARMAQIQTYGAQRTTDRDEIEAWVEERGGMPAIIESTWDGNTAVLRIDFGEQDDRIMYISWDLFFDIFEDGDLEFLHQNYLSDGSMSRFYRFVERD